MWNELSYEAQLKIIDLIKELLSKQSDEETQEGLSAAVKELELWSNSPCEVLDAVEEPYVAQAVEQYTKEK